MQGMRLVWRARRLKSWLQSVTMIRGGRKDSLQAKSEKFCDGLHALLKFKKK